MKRLYLILLTTICLACKSEQLETINEIISPEGVHVIDYSQAAKSNVDLDDLLKGKIKIIDLETVADSYVAEITKVLSYEDKFIVFDSRLNNVLAFSSAGKFLFKFGARGNGPGEYVDVVDVMLDKENDRIGILSVEQRQIHYFNLRGEFEESLRLPFQATRLAAMSKGNIAFALTYFDEDFKNFKVTNDKGNVLAGYFEYPQDVFPMGLYNITGLMVENRGGVLYSDATSSTIHQVTNDGTTFPKYQFDLGKETWPEKDQYDFRTFFASIQRGGVSYLTNYYREDDRYLVARVNKSVPTGSYVIVDYKTILYDKNHKVAYVLSDDLFKSFSGPLGYDEGLGFISTVDQEKLAELCSSEKSNKFFHSDHNVLKTQSIEEQNPSLVLYNFKRQ